MFCSEDIEHNFFDHFENVLEMVKNTTPHLYDHEKPISCLLYDHETFIYTYFST
jgi:hypothetical protein